MTGPPPDGRSLSRTRKRPSHGLLLVAAVLAVTATLARAQTTGPRHTQTARAATTPSQQTPTTISLVITTPPPTRMPRPTPPKATARATTSPKSTSNPPVPPKPTPTPVARPFAYPYVPPLSPDEAHALVRACIQILMINDASTLAARCHKVSEILGKTITYLTILDQRYSTLDSYRWHLIDRLKVSLDIDTDLFEAKPVIPRVSAISFRADYGDVYIYSVVVYDDQGTSTLFDLRRLIEHNFPHEEICYLLFPTTVKEVALKYQVHQRRKLRRPRLAVFAGVAREEEYLKQALGYLHDARREANRAVSHPGQAARHIEAACQNLRQAAARLIRFRLQRKY